MNTAVKPQEAELSRRQQAKELEPELSVLAKWVEARVAIDLQGATRISPGYFDVLLKTRLSAERNAGRSNLTFVLKNIPARCREFHHSMARSHGPFPHAPNHRNRPGAGNQKPPVEKRMSKLNTNCPTCNGSRRKATPGRRGGHYYYCSRCRSASLVGKPVRMPIAPKDARGKYKHQDRNGALQSMLNRYEAKRITAEQLAKKQRVSLRTIYRRLNYARQVRNTIWEKENARQ